MGIYNPIPFFYLESKIMNELANIVSGALIGNDFVNIALGGRFYKVASPTPYTIAKMLKVLSGVEQKELVSFDDIIKNAPGNMEKIAQSIAICAYPGCRFLAQYRIRRLSKRIMRCSASEIREAFEDILKSMNATDFFYCAQSVKTLIRSMAKQKS